MVSKAKNILVRMNEEESKQLHLEWMKAVQKTGIFFSFNAFCKAKLLNKEKK